MIGFEIKKLVRRPIFLFVIVVIAAIQIAVTMQELDAIRPSTLWEMGVYSQVIKSLVVTARRARV